MTDDIANTAVADPSVAAGESTAANQSVAANTNSGNDSVKEPTFILDKFLEKHLRYTKKRVIFNFYFRFSKNFFINVYRLSITPAS